MKSITIIGTDIHGNQTSETIDLSGDKPVYSSNQYQSLGAPIPSLYLQYQRLSLWKRFVFRFFKKWPVVSGGIHVRE